jgi:peptidoglycan/xylan/chitin deacetylase (PgdA/CDA1 family)
MSGPEISLERGAFIVSIDTELAWGCFDREDREARWALEERSREAVTKLLTLFERYGIPGTWALVGHLFLERCSGHPEMPRPKYDWFPHDWYRFDPASDLRHAPLWYAPDMIRQIQAASPRQELASHSFAHPLFGDPGCGADAAEADIAACVEAARPWGVDLRSFVFPRNRIGHRDALARHGFSCYRGPDPAWFRSLKRPVKRAAHYLDDLLALPPPTVLPRRDGQLWNIPGSVMLQGMDGPRGWIPSGCRTRRCIAGLERAAHRREIFHLWFHPINFSVAMDRMLDALEPALHHAADLRDAGKLETLTMGALAERLGSPSLMSSN